MPGMKRLLIALFACATVATPADDAAPADPWQPVRFLLGRWEGTVQGEAGTGTVTRRYALVLGGKFIEEHNVSTYPAQEKNRKGEVHEHRGFLSYDRKRQKLLMRQFHQESFVILYSLSSGSGTQLVFDSESVENLDGYKTRETYEIYSNDEFVETFEVAEPGKPFDVYSRTRFTRIGRATGE